VEVCTEVHVDFKRVYAKLFQIGHILDLFWFEYRCMNRIVDVMVTFACNQLPCNSLIAVVEPEHPHHCSHAPDCCGPRFCPCRLLYWSIDPVMDVRVDCPRQHISAARIDL